jgi:hypothetical protein
MFSLFNCRKASAEDDLVQQNVFEDYIAGEEFTDLDDIPISESIDLPLVPLSFSFSDLRNAFNHDVLDVRIDEAMAAQSLLSAFSNGSDKGCLSRAITLSSGLVVLGNSDKVRKDDSNTRIRFIFFIAITFLTIYIF